MNFQLENITLQFSDFKLQKLNTIEDGFETEGSQLNTIGKLGLVHRELNTKAEPRH
jgi:hypothetical protein